MKKGLFVLILFLSLSFLTASQTYAFPLINPDLFKIKIPSGIFTSPTPTPAPTNTPIPEPTTAPSETPTPVTPTDEIVPTISTPSGTTSPTSTTAANVSPTQKPKKTVVLSPKDLIYGGAVGLLVLIILVQAWPAIKKFLHDKTA